MSNKGWSNRIITDAVGGIHQVVSHGGHVSGHQAGVHHMAARQHQGGGVQQALQLTIGHQRT